MPIPFGEPLDDRSRERFGRYRSRYSRRKVGRAALTNFMEANGTNWVDMTWALATYPLILNDFDKSMYQYEGLIIGAWTGTPEFRVLIDDTKVYPFTSSVDIVSGNTVNFGSLSMGVRMGEVIKLQFRSSNAADGVGEELVMQINYVTYE